MLDGLGVGDELEHVLAGVGLQAEVHDLDEQRPVRLHLAEQVRQLLVRGAGVLMLGHHRVGVESDAAVLGDLVAAVVLIFVEAVQLR